MKSWARGMFKLMSRFWPTIGFVCLFAGIVLVLVNLVKTGIIDPQGQWFGSWPLQGADDCRTKLYPTGRFEMECRGKDKYAGAGTWQRDRNHLLFEFRMFVRNEKPVADMKVMTLRIDGVRDGMVVGGLNEAGEPHSWRRARP